MVVGGWPQASLGGSLSILGHCAVLLKSYKLRLGWSLLLSSTNILAQTLGLLLVWKRQAGILSRRVQPHTLFHLTEGSTTLLLLGVGDARVANHILGESGHSAGQRQYPRGHSCRTYNNLQSVPASLVGGNLS